jgi:hypothetical protein
MDRRIPFFAVMALICLGLAEVAGPKYRVVALAVAGVYAALTVAFALDDRIGARRARRTLGRRSEGERDRP